MNRRNLLAVTGGGALTGLCGCLDRVQPVNSDEEDYEVNLMEYPDPPSSLTNESVVEFVEKYEEAHLHNDLLTEDTTDISIGCPAAIDLEIDHGFYVLTICHGSTRSGDSVGHLGPDPVFYHVTDGQFERVAEREIGRGESYGNGRRSSEVQGFRMVNFDNKDHEMQISLSHLSDSSETLILEETYPLRSKSLFSISSVLATEGDFELEVTLEDGTSAKYDWIITDIEPPFGVNIYVTMDKSIRFGTTSHPQF